MNPPLSPAREELRLAALESLHLVDTPAEERFDRITRIARELFDVPIVEINLLDAHQQFTKSPQKPGVELFSERTASFCDVTIRQSDVLVVPDATEDPRFSERSTVTGDRHIRFYAGRSLVVGDDQRVGTLCLVDTEPRSFSNSEEQLLEEIGVWVERELRDNSDRDRAADIYQQLLPVNGRYGDFEIAGMARPFGHVGGDFYSWFHRDDLLDITLADVMGKGTAAAILAATLRAAVRSHPGCNVSELLATVSAGFQPDFDDTETFATLFHCRLNVSTGQLDYVDAGHGLTVVIRASGDWVRLGEGGLPMGILADAHWPSGSLILAPGDTLVTFSDGVLDLYDGTLESVDQLVQLVQNSANPQDFVDRVRQSCATDAVTDDVSIVALRRDR